MPFDCGPVLSYEGAGRYKTVGNCAYVGKDEVLHIPSDLITDLATVPRVFWAVLPPTGTYEKAAVLHDVLCTRLAVAYRHHQIPQVNARDADGLFRRVMRENGVGFLTRWAMWTGVRLGALANPARRDGWIRDLPMVSLISTAVLSIATLAVIGIDRGAHWLVGLIG